MITKEIFKKIMEIRDRYDSNVDRLYELGINIIDSNLYSDFNIIFDTLISTNFSMEGVEWIDWWLYESSTRLYIKDGKEITVDIDELWELVKNYVINGYSS